MPQFIFIDVRLKACGNVTLGGRVRTTRVQRITLSSPHFLTADPGYPGDGGQVKTTDYTLLGVCNQIQTLLHKDLLQPVIGFNGQHTGRQVPPPPQNDYEVFVQNDYAIFVQNDYEVFRTK